MIGGIWLFTHTVSIYTVNLAFCKQFFFFVLGIAYNARIGGKIDAKGLIMRT